MPGIAPDLERLAIPIGDLVPLPGNPRRGDVAAVKRSYERFGQRKPIVAQRKTREVLAGNHQLAAAIELGWSHIAVVWTDDDAATAKAYALADNRTADLGDYDNDLLAALLAEVQAEGDDALLAATGYDNDAVAKLLGTFVDPVPGPSLADKFGVPPMSVLDRRQGVWQDRKRQWLALGIESEVGRDGHLTWGSDNPDPVSQKIAAAGTTSIFDPVVCELVYRWFTSPGDRVLDPFAGGSVRGVVASVLDRAYTGVELRTEQVAANTEQAHLATGPTPRWLVGDATCMGTDVGDGYDLVFSCPPYGDLEKYSDDPADLSTMTPAAFREAHRAAITGAISRLAPDRYAAWVISDIRDPRGYLRGLVGETVAAFEACGARLLNDFVVLDMVSTAAVRAERPFRANRKSTRVHQHLLVFVKGNVKASAQRVEATATGIAHDLEVDDAAS